MARRTLVMMGMFCLDLPCQYRDCDVVLLFFKMLPLRETGGRYMRSLCYFLKLHINLQLSQNKKSLIKNASEVRVSILPGWLFWKGDLCVTVLTPRINVPVEKGSCWLTGLKFINMPSGLAKQGPP